MVDVNRPERDRTEQYREYAARPETKERVLKWRTENKEKSAQYYRDYRDRKLTEDSVSYLKRNAENQKKWREANPEKHKEIQKRHQETIVYRMKYYKGSASDKGIEWKLTDDEFELYCNMNCFYCGKPPSEEELNGVDRIDPDGHYTTENCRACCMSSTVVF